jgi:hypothetical protein
LHIYDGKLLEDFESKPWWRITAHGSYYFQCGITSLLNL